MKRLVGVLGLVGVMLALPAAEASRKERGGGRPGFGGRPLFEVPLDGSALRVGTDDDRARGDLRRFVIPTLHGPLRGQIFSESDEWLVVVSSTEESAVIRYVNEPGGSLSALVRFSQHGSIRLEFYEGGASVVDNAIRSCADLSSGLLREAVAEATSRFGPVLARMKRQAPLPADRPAAQLFLLVLRTLRLALDHAACDLPDPVLEPLYGICAVHDLWGGCVECCMTDDVFDSIAGALVGVAASLLFENTLIGSAIGLGMSLDNCVEVCEGKKGDPSPIWCNNGQGTCSAVCPTGPGESSPDCPVGTLCCTVEPTCPSPWDPGCGVCVSHPQNYCCQNPYDPSCG